MPMPRPAAMRPHFCTSKAVPSAAASCANALAAIRVVARTDSKPSIFFFILTASLGLFSGRLRFRVDRSSDAECLVHLAPRFMRGSRERLLAKPHSVVGFFGVLVMGHRHG